MARRISLDSTDGNGHNLTTTRVDTVLHHSDRGIFTRPRQQPRLKFLSSDNQIVVRVRGSIHNIFRGRKTDSRHDFGEKSDFGKKRSPLKGFNKGSVT